jgi:Kef-type K+ transport system membrane component KefB
MNYKKLLISGLAGGALNFFLMWFLTSFLTNASFPPVGNVPLLNYLMGSLIIGLLLAYVFIRFGDVKTFMSGLTNGLILGILFGAFSVLLDLFNLFSTELAMIAWQIVITLVIASLTGGVVGYLIGKINDTHIG